MRTPGGTIWRTLPGATVTDVGEGRWELTARCPTPLKVTELEASSFRVGNRTAENVALKKGHSRKPVTPGAVFVLNIALSEPVDSE
jgi:hypothetical protein